MYKLVTWCKKAFTFALLLVFFFFTILPFPIPALNAAVYGDVNEDGMINVHDVVLVMRYVLGFESLTPRQKTTADVNGDGRVNVLDVNLLLQKTLRLIDQFPVSARPGQELIDTFIAAAGITPGQKVVIVILNVENAAAYQVSVGETPLDYSEVIGGFLGEVNEADAVRSRVTVSR